jgi:hypothetical protein
MPKTLVGLKIIAFSPFVPCLDEYDVLLGCVMLNQIDGTPQDRPEKVWR